MTIDSPSPSQPVDSAGTPVEITPTDRELIAAAKTGDALAMETLYLRHRDWAYRNAYGVLGNAEDAQDVVQDVFQKFFRKIETFELRAKFTTYLYPVIRNRCIDRIRRRKPTTELVTDVLSPTLRDERREREAVIEMVIGLPEKQQDVVILRFAEGLQLDEIAERLDIAIGTVKSRLHHALVALRTQIEP